MPLTFENAGDAPSPDGFAYNVFVDRYSIDAEHTFAMDQPSDCSMLVPLPGSDGSSAFTLAALAPREARHCVLRVSRTATSTSDARVIVQQDAFDLTAANSVSLRVGGPVEARLRVEKEPASYSNGRAEQNVRILVDHDGPVDLQHMNFGYCLTEQATTIEVGFPGACRESDIPYGACFSGSASYEFDGPVRAGETSSCLLRVSQPWPLDNFGYGTRLALDTLAQNANGGWTAVLDRGAEADLTIGGAVASATRHTIPAWSSLAAIIAALGMIVLAALRR